jgi:molecular chaperone GrpE
MTDKKSHPKQPHHAPPPDEKAEAAAREPLPGAAEAADAEQMKLLEQLRADLEETKDRVLRSQAELDNYRKRAAREIEDHRRYANLPLVRDLLPVLDNMERAIGAAGKNCEAAGLLEGVKLVVQQLESVLTKHHCQRIEALHQPFDPHLHEAISQQPSAEFPPGTVLLVAQCGFQLFDRVVRPSQVIVSAAPAEPVQED